MSFLATKRFDFPRLEFSKLFQVIYQPTAQKNEVLVYMGIFVFATKKNPAQDT